MNIPKLVSLNFHNPAAQIYFATFAARRRSFAQTTVQDVVDLARRQGYSLAPSDVVAFFQGLEDADCGQFEQSEGGARFSWLYKASLVAQTTLKNREMPLVAEEAPVVFITHSLRLRADVTLTLQLPPDFSESEAKRLCHFIISLPLPPNDITPARSEETSP